MRYLLSVAMLLVMVAGAIVLIPQEVRRPAPSDRHLPAPTAAEESGVREADDARASPVRPLLHSQVPGPGPAPTVRRPSHAAAPVQEPGPRGDGVPAAPSAPMSPDERSVRVPFDERGMREHEEPAAQPSSNEHQAAENPVGPRLQQPADVLGRAPVLAPPVLLTPVAGYPAEGYDVALDRSALTPRLSVEAIQGRVVLRVLVRTDGSVAEVHVVESSGAPALDEAAARAAAGWAFAPATRDGQPIDAWVLIPVRFVLR